MSEGLTLAEDFSEAVTHLIDSIEDAQLAASKRHLMKSTRDDVLELALVRSLGLFEEFVGDLFLLALQNRLGEEISPTYLAQDFKQAKMIVGGVDSGGENSFISWMPFKERTLGRATKLLENGQPFSRLAIRQQDISLLKEMTIVRNRIAHDSRAARATFEQLAGEKGYPKLRAADYLGSIRGGETEIILALSRLQSIAKGLAEPTETGARAHLSDEDLVDSKKTVPPGTYECTRSGHEVTTTKYQPLRNCSDCPAPSPCQSCGQDLKPETMWRRQ